MKITKADTKGLKLAIKYLKTGKSVVYPTDTSYGLGVDATNAKAVKTLYQIKGREFRKPVHVVVSGIAMAQKYVKFNPLALRLFKKFLPGPLTIVCDLSPSLSPRLGRGVKLLSAGTGTIGIRMPNRKVVLALVKKFGRPITTTSANLSGAATPYSIREIIRQFKNQKYQPDLILDAGRLPKRKPSTFVRIRGSKIKILRRGPISKKELNSYIRRNS